MKTTETLLSIRKVFFPLRWWFIFFGYALVFAIVVASAIVIVIFGSSLGEKLALEWLLAMLIGMLNSILVIQPIKVNFLTFTSILISKNGIF